MTKKRRKKSSSGDDEETIQHCVLFINGKVAHYYPTKQLARIASASVKSSSNYEYKCFDSVKDAFDFIMSLQSDSTNSDEDNDNSSAHVVTPEKPSKKPFDKKNSSKKPTAKKSGNKKFEPPSSKKQNKSSKSTGKKKSSAFIPPNSSKTSSTKAYDEFMKNNPSLQSQINKLANQGSVGWVVHQFKYDGDEDYDPIKQVIVLDLFDSARNNPFWCHKSDKWTRVLQSFSNNSIELDDVDPIIYDLKSFSLRDMDTDKLVDNGPKKIKVKNSNSDYTLPVTAFWLEIPLESTESYITAIVNNITKGLCNEFLKGSYAQQFEQSASSLKNDVNQEDGKCWFVLESLVDSEITIMKGDSFDAMFLIDFQDFQEKLGTW